MRAGNDQGATMRNGMEMAMNIPMYLRKRLTPMGSQISCVKKVAVPETVGFKCKRGGEEGGEDRGQDGGGELARRRRGLLGNANGLLQDRDAGAPSGEEHTGVEFVAVGFELEEAQRQRGGMALSPVSAPEIFRVRSGCRLRRAARMPRTRFWGCSRSRRATHSISPGWCRPSAAAMTMPAISGEVQRRWLMPVLMAAPLPRLAAWRRSSTRGRRRAARRCRGIRAAAVVDNDDAGKGRGGEGSYEVEQCRGWTVGGDQHREPVELCGGQLSTTACRRGGVQAGVID